MAISQPSYPTTTSALVTHIGSYVDTQRPVTRDSIPFNAPTATVSTSPPWRVPAAGSIARVTLNTATAPVGSNLVVAWRLNGTTFATQTITAGTTTEQSATPGQAVAAGDKITVQITSIGSTTAATGVVAQADITYT